MATYNGERYILDQVLSILSQMSYGDELIISDDSSKDSTKEIIKKINDRRIVLLEGPHKGIIKNFENAIINCKNDYIFLADQDDLWDKSKINVIIQEFMANPSITCIVHDCQVVDEDNNKTLIESFFDFRNSKSGTIKNIIKNSYIGCCMCFHKSLVKYCIPIPEKIEMHDQWIGIISDIKGETLFIKDRLIRYRRHKHNASQIKHHPFYIMAKNKFVFIFNLIKRLVSIENSNL